MTSWFARLVNRGRLDREATEEIQEHLAEKIDDLVANGMNRDEATLAARRAFGNVTLTEENAREVWGWPRLETWWTDMRYACRQLRRYPGVTLVAVVSSALGIGASTAVFCVMHAVLVSPYPYRDPGRLVHVHVFDHGQFLFDLPLSSSQFEQFQRAPVLDDAMAMDVEAVSATDGVAPEAVEAGFLSPNAFEFLGVTPLLGRVFTAADGGSTSDSLPTAVLSYRFWQKRYSGDPEVVGRVLRLDDEDHLIIGVMPRRFAWWNCDVWVRLKPSSDPDRLATVFARLGDGISARHAEQELQALVATLAAQRPAGFPSTVEIRLQDMGEIATGQLSGTFSVVATAVGLLLFIGCANVSILLLARGRQRTQELAIRVAIGASRGRIMRQLLTESLVISIAGGLLGVLIAYGSVDLITVLLPEGTFPSESVIELSTPVLLFSAAMSSLAGVLSGLSPALQFSHPELHSRLQSGSTTTAGARGSHRGHDLLVAAQLALTVVLLAGAGATALLFNSLLNAPLPYDSRELTSIRVDLRDGTYADWHDRVSYYERIRLAAGQSPQVISATLSLNDLPPTTPFRISTVVVPGEAPQPRQTVFLSEVSGDYFETLRIPLLDGRSWNEWETERAVPVAVVNASMARLFWPSGSPLRQLLYLPDLKPVTSWALNSPWNDGRVEVIGIAVDVPNIGLKDPAAPAIYIPYTLVVADSFRLIIRSAGSPLSAVDSVRAQIQAIDPEQPIGQVRTALELLDAQGWARERFTAALFSAFAVLGVLLSAAGLYSVVSYVVTQRSQEFGVRMALGARRIDVIRLVFSWALGATFVGVAAGLGLCVIFSAPLLRLAHADVRDPYLLAPVVAVLAVVAVAAAVVPAFRAASVSPMNVLRAE